jgi:serine/threonine protein kinase
VGIYHSASEKEGSSRGSCLYDSVLAGDDAEKLLSSVREFVAERRQHPRVNLEFPIRVGDKGEALVQDLSGAALKVATTEKLEKGENVSVEIGWGDQPQHFRAKVGEVRPAIFGQSYVVLHVDESQQDAREYLERLVKKVVEVQHYLDGHQPERAPGLRGPAAWNLARRAERTIRDSRELVIRDSQELAVIDPDRVEVSKPALEDLKSRYEMGEKLGTWGVGDVYEATHRLLQRPVLLKVLREELRGDRLATKRMEHEARLASRLACRGVVDVLDFGEEGDGRGVYYAMEALAGETLDGAIGRGADMVLSDVARLGLHLTEVLARVHLRGEGHFDLCPENVFLKKGSTAFVSPVLINVAGREVWGSPNQTFARGGDFRPPEGPMSSPGPGCDLYAVARILELLLASVAKGGERRGGARRLEEIIARELSSRKTERFKDALEMETALWDCLRLLEAEPDAKPARFIEALPDEESRLERKAGPREKGKGEAVGEPGEEGRMEAGGSPKATAAHAVTAHPAADPKRETVSWGSPRAGQNPKEQKQSEQSRGEQSRGEQRGGEALDRPVSGEYALRPERGRTMTKIGGAVPPAAPSPKRDESPYRKTVRGIPTGKGAPSKRPAASGGGDASGHTSFKKEASAVEKPAGGLEPDLAGPSLVEELIEQEVGRLAPPPPPSPPSNPEAKGDSSGTPKRDAADDAASAGGRAAPLEADELSSARPPQTPVEPQPHQGPVAKGFRLDRRHKLLILVGGGAVGLLALVVTVLIWVFSGSDGRDSAEGKGGARKEAGKRVASSGSEARPDGGRGTKVADPRPDGGRAAASHRGASNGGVEGDDGSPQQKGEADGGVIADKRDGASAEQPARGSSPDSAKEGGEEGKVTWGEHLGKARRRIATRRYKEAIKHLNIALKMRDGHYLRYLFARCYARQRKNWPAIYHTKKAVAKAPSKARYRDYLGLLYIRVGKRKAACSNFRKAIKLRPKWSRAKRHHKRYCTR